MKPKSFRDEVADDVVERVVKSISSERSGDQCTQIIEFWKSSTEQRASSSGTVEEISSDEIGGRIAPGVIALLPALSYFYYSGAKRPAKLIADNWEVILPYLQRNSDLLEFWIVERPAQFGQLSPALKIPVPNPTSAFMRQATSEYRTATDSDNVLFKIFPEATGILDATNNPPFGMLKIPEGPALRLPCRNIALQCAFELVKQEIGDFNVSIEELLERARRERLRKLTLRREPLNITMLTALVSWPLWEAADFTHPQRFSYLDNVMRKGAPQAYDYRDETLSDEVLRVRMLRLLNRHRRKFALRK